MTLDDLLELLEGPMRSSSEAELQGEIERALIDGRVKFEREARLSGPDRIDFLVEIVEHRTCSGCGGTGDHFDEFLELLVDHLECDGRGWWDDRTRVGVEVKVKGGVPEIERQLARYAAHDSVDVLVLVSTRLRHARMPSTLCGKTVRTVIKVEASLM